LGSEITRPVSATRTSTARYTLVQVSAGISADDATKELRPTQPPATRLKLLPTSRIGHECEPHSLKTPTVLRAAPCRRCREMPADSASRGCPRVVLSGRDRSVAVHIHVALAGRHLFKKAIEIQVLTLDFEAVWSLFIRPEGLIRRSHQLIGWWTDTSATPARLRGLVMSKPTPRATNCVPRNQRSLAWSSFSVANRSSSARMTLPVLVRGRASTR
jgi:hypothetical protein